MLVVIFAVQNTAPVTMHFLAMDFHLPMAIPMVMMLLLGLILGLLYYLVRDFSARRQSKKAVQEAEARANKAEMERKLIERQMAENEAMRRGRVGADGRADIEAETPAEERDDR